MILTGKQIKWAHDRGYLDISPFDEKRLNPNSYNVRLADEILTYNEGMLDMKRDNPYTIQKIPEEGLLIRPGKLYLGRTVERTETKCFVPMLEGRSSVGRLGIFIHATAGFGDIGFKGYWTLEISCVQPITIYPGVEIGQVYYHTIGSHNDIWIPYAWRMEELMTYDENGKYQNNTGVQPSMLWKDFDEGQTNWD